MTNFDTTAIPSNTNDRKKIKDAIFEGATLMEKQKYVGESIKDIIDMLHEEYEMPKTLVRKAMRTCHKDNYSEEVAQSAAFEVFYENIMDVEE